MARTSQLFSQRESNFEYFGTTQNPTEETFELLKQKKTSTRKNIWEAIWVIQRDLQTQNIKTLPLDDDNIQEK